MSQTKTRIGWIRIQIIIPRLFESKKYKIECFRLEFWVHQDVGAMQRARIEMVVTTFAVAGDIKLR